MTDIVITGTGVLSAAGCGGASAFAAARGGENLFSDLEIGEANGAPAARVPFARVDPALAVWPSDEPFWVNSRKFATQSAVWAVNAARQAVLQAGITADIPPERGGVVVASAHGGEEDLVKAMPRIAKLVAAGKGPIASLLYDYVPDFSYVRDIPSQAGQFVAKATNFLGSNVAIFGESNVGGFAGLAAAVRMIQSEEVDRVVVTGVGSAPTVTALRRMYDSGNIARASAPGNGPFDRARHGTFPGEGAVALVIEGAETAAARGAVPLAELRMCETCCMMDAGRAVRAMAELALAQCDGAADLWWASGIGSAHADAIEGGMLRDLHKGAVTSSKSSLGNMSEAAGLLDIALAVEALQARVAPPINLLQEPDSAFAGIDFVVGQPRPLPDGCDILVAPFTGMSMNVASAAAAVLLRGASRQ